MFAFSKKSICKERCATGIRRIWQSFFFILLHFCCFVFVFELQNPLHISPFEGEMRADVCESGLIDLLLPCWLIPMNFFDSFDLEWMFLGFLSNLDLFYFSFFGPRIGFCYGNYKHHSVCTSSSQHQLFYQWRELSTVIYLSLLTCTWLSLKRFREGEDFSR